MVIRPKLDKYWFFSSVLATIFTVVGAFLPLWKLELIAPQYPKGLFIVAYGYAMGGDLKEINSLNHYVGLSPLDPETILELKLFPVSVLAIALALLIGAVLFKGKQRILSVLASAAVPVFMLIDLQYQLYVFGHEIRDDAPLDLLPFTPHVLGRTQVMNFHSEARPAIGFWFFVAAVLSVALGPRSWNWLKATWNNTGKSLPKSIGTFIAVLVIGFGVVVASFDSRAMASASFSTKVIADAIDDADAGETVHVAPGIYVGRLIIDKPVVLIGDGMPIIDGNRLGDVVIINANDVTVKGFQIRGSSREVTSESAAIRILGDRAQITSNTISDALYGISAIESSGHKILNNSVTSILDLSAERRGHSVYLHYSADNRVSGNKFTRAKDGVYLQFSDRNVISGNAATHVRYATHLMFSNDNEISGNTFLNNVAGGVLMFSGGVRFFDNEIGYNQSSAAGYGLMFKEVDDINVVDNLIHHNRIALALEGAPFTPSAKVVVRNNLIGYNRVAVGLFTTTNVLFAGNTFVGNRDHVNAVAGSIEFKNKWSEPGNGNYWDDYRGYDADGDGVGDIKYSYRGIFDSLAEKKPLLHAYDFTLARIALDMAANWFPIYRPEPRVTDEYPLMQRTKFIVAKQTGDNQMRELGAMLLLIAAPSTMLLVSSRFARNRWKVC